jgi:hypothetical protein
VAHIDVCVAEIARCFGAGLRGPTLSVYFTRNLRPNAKLIQEALARGEDPSVTVTLGVEAKVTVDKGQ